MFMVEICWPKTLANESGVIPTLGLAADTMVAGAELCAHERTAAANNDAIVRMNTPLKGRTRIASSV
jgi:hypothetical protein